MNLFEILKSKLAYIKKTAIFARVNSMVIFRKMLCLIGFHEWRWSIGDNEIVYLGSDPPSHAKCSFCNERYKEI